MARGFSAGERSRGFGAREGGGKSSAINEINDLSDKSALVSAEIQKLNEEKKAAVLQRGQPGADEKVTVIFDKIQEALKQHSVLDDKANKLMFEMMSSLTKEVRDGKAEKGKIGDGKPGNGVAEADGKTRLRLEDFAYMLSSADNYYDAFDYIEEGTNQGMFALDTRSGEMSQKVESGSETLIPFDYEGEEIEDETTKVIGYDREGFSIEEDATYYKKVVADVTVDRDALRDELESKGFVFADKDFDRFARAMDYSLLKSAPDGDWEER